MSEASFPQEWVKCTIGDACALNPKEKLPDNLDVGFMPMAGVPTNHFGTCNFETRPWEKVKKGITQFKNGDVIFAKITPCFENSKAAIIRDFPSGWGAGSTEYYVLRPYGDLVRPEILFALIKSKEFLVSGAVNMSGSVGHKRVPKDFVSGYELPLPPFAEQKVIADKLDTLLAQVENTKARLERIPKILKRFRQSVLAAAVSGRLTEEWRESTTVSESVHELLSRWERNRQQHFFETQRELLELRKIKKAKKFKQPSKPDTDTAGAFNIPAEWLVVSVSQFAECLDSQRVPVKKEDRKSAIGLYPYFGANGQVDRVDDYIFDGDFVLVTEDETFYGREKPIAYRYSGKCWVNNHAHILQAETKDANGYLFYSLMHYNVIPWLSGTTGRAKLTQAALNTLPLGLPPEAEISEIVRRIDQLFAHADRIEQQVNNALARVNSLTQSILAKAFRGELTEQWRKDNPELISGENSAAALLERIKVERAAMKPTSAARKRKTSA